VSAHRLNRTESFRPMKAEHPEGVVQDWIIIDASDWVLGRLSTVVATILMGKNKPQFTPHTDVGNYVVLINCDKIRVTGRKLDQKIKYHHTGHRIKSKTLAQRMAEDAGEVLHDSVRLMLPRTRLGRQQLLKLKAYAGSEHPHQAQKLIPYETQSSEAS
jgi:large subunit ribosomal protein L13